MALKPGLQGEDLEDDPLLVLLPGEAQEPAVSGVVLQATPLLVPAPAAALLCGVSERTWRKFDRCGRVPSPLRWGKRRLWCVEELRRWAAAGCPPRERWKFEAP